MNANIACILLLLILAGVHTRDTSSSAILQKKERISHTIWIKVNKIRRVALFASPVLKPRRNKWDFGIPNWVPWGRIYVRDHDEAGFCLYWRNWLQSQQLCQGIAELEKVTNPTRRKIELAVPLLHNFILQLWEGFEQQEAIRGHAMITCYVVSLSCLLWNPCPRTMPFIGAHSIAPI